MKIRIGDMKIRIIIEKDSKTFGEDMIDAISISSCLMSEYNFNVEDIVSEKRRYVIKLSRGKHE